MIQAAYQKLVERKDLTAEESRASVAEIFSGEASPAIIAAFLTALRMKGETTDEIAGAAQAMRAAATRVDAGAVVVADTCGTGGDKQGSFNISTAASFVVAGAGFTVAKHGNRSISSQCGSADVLEVLGVKIDPPVAVAERCLREVGIAFLFAPQYHPAMKNAMPVRKELGVRTVFNVLGPLCNPAGANAQVIGVFTHKLLEGLARVLVRLGVKHSMVVHGEGHDEIILAGATEAAEIVDGKVRKRKFTAKDFGLKRSPASALRGGTKEENAAIIRAVLGGEKGPRRDVVVANAAAAILVASRATAPARSAAGERPWVRTDVKDLKSAARVAEKSIDSGAALEKLQKLAAMSREAPPGSAARVKPGLDEIVARKRRDLERTKAALPLALLEKKLSDALPVRDFAGALRRTGEVSVIAELKKASPSAGLLREYYHVPTGAAAYEKAGARALSVLTESNFFLGDLGHLAEAKKACGLPVLRKDFVFDPYQVYEARAAGADAVLLIAALLPAVDLKPLLTLVKRLGMTPLVEAHDPAEVAAALAAGAEAVGINSRNLKDLSMSPDAFERMVPLVPKDKLVVAESGIKTAEDVKRLKALGVQAILVGESLLRQADLESAARFLVEAGKF